MNAPLVNDYKKPFIVRRLLQTLLGGLRLYFPTPAPLYIYFLQIVLFAFIPASCGIFIYLFEFDLPHASVINGCIILLYGLFIHVLALCLQRNPSRKTAPEQIHSIGDEEEILFDSIWGSKTWLFLIPPKKATINIFLHSSIAGVLSGLTVYYLHLDSNQNVFFNQNLRHAFNFVGIITSSIGIWPLIVGSPPEPAVFLQLPFDLQALSRPSHMMTCFAVHAAASSNPEVIWLFYANCFVHVVYALCPILWVTGALPPIDSYFLWAMERWLVIVLGGSPMASNRRLMIHCVIGTASLVGLAAVPNIHIFSVACALRGLILSLDMGYLLHSLQWNATFKNIDKGHIIESPFNKLSSKLLIALYGGLVLGTLGLSLAIHLTYHIWYRNLEKTNYNISDQRLLGEHLQNNTYLFQTSIMNTAWLCLVFLCVLMLCIHKMQRPFIFHFFRNPIYFHIKRSTSKGIGFFFISQFIHFGGPFISLLFLHLLTIKCDLPSSGRGFMASYLFAMSFSFIFRQIWQYPEYNLIVLSSYYTFEKFANGLLKSFSWDHGCCLPFEIHMFSLLVLWIWGSLSRMKTILTFSITSLTQSKQRKVINYFLAGFNTAIIPILISIACLSSVFSFPLFPLFTLPLFLIGFPRPLLFWPFPVGYSANHCSDTIYYQQLIPYVLEEVNQAIFSGSLGIIQVGEIFLLRWEDRFFWLQILECSFTGFSYSFKGLELQETSCHAVEASRVDSVFSRAFDVPSNYNFFNYFPLHCITPLTKVTAIGYSDTKNVLTGVIDSPETLKVVQDYFLKALLYFVLYYSSANVEPSPNVSRAQSGTRLGSADLKTRKAFADLPKAESIFESRSSLNTSNGGGSSLKSQNGRGSRMAWVSESKSSVRVEERLEGRASRGTRQSISVQKEEERNGSEEVVRPVSCDSDQNILDKSLIDQNNILPFVTLNKSQSVRQRQKGSPESATSSISNEIISNIDLRKTEKVTHIVCDNSSDSETDSTKEFFTKSLPRRPNQGSLNFSLRERNITKANQRISLSLKPIYNSVLSNSLSPHLSWIIDPPYNEDTLEDMQDSFPVSWFKFLLKQFGLFKLQKLSSSDGNLEKSSQKERQLENLLEDEVLEESYRTLIASCQITTLGTEVSFLNASQVLKLFNGELVNSKGLEWIKSKSELIDIVIKSYRIAVKLSLDHTLVGPTNNSWIDLQTILEEYNSDWYVGPDQVLPTSELSNRVIKDEEKNEPTSWNEAVRREVPSLFSLGYNEVKGVYTSHLLTLGEAELSVGSLDGETVRSIWASLTGELLYLTNDDDERYSIQAHPVILRNLTIQAADPPLGYPIYSSPPLRMGLPWLYTRNG